MGSEKMKISTKKVENLRSLIMDIARSNPSMLPKVKQIEERVLNHLSASGIPDHPTYSVMILTALSESDKESGLSEKSILKFTIEKYKDLSPAHASFLKSHLEKLLLKGEIIRTSKHRFLKASENTVERTHEPLMSKQDKIENRSKKRKRENTAQRTHEPMGSKQHERENTAERAHEPMVLKPHKKADKITGKRETRERDRSEGNDFHCKTTCKKARHVVEPRTGLKKITIKVPLHRIAAMVEERDKKEEKLENVTATELVVQEDKKIHLKQKNEEMEQDNETQHQTSPDQIGLREKQFKTCHEIVKLGKLAKQFTKDRGESEPLSEGEWIDLLNYVNNIKEQITEIVKR